MAARRSVWLFAALGLALCVLAGMGCVGLGPGGPSGISVLLVLAQSTVEVGTPSVATATVTIDGLPSGGRTVSFTSSNPLVATVTATAVTNASGIATAPLVALTAGATTIAASYGGDSDDAVLTVRPTGSSTAAGLVFIHHSVGQDWLDNGLRAALLTKPYINACRDITYGTELAADSGRPSTLGVPAGDSTDVGHWIYWFNDYMGRIRSFGGANHIVMIKPCFPNSAIWADGAEPGDPFTGDAVLADFQAVFRNTLGSGIVYHHETYAYHALADAFANQPNTLFVVCTPPPLDAAATSPAEADRARRFSTWLAEEWLDHYNADHPGRDNVTVFNVFDVLAYPDGSGETANTLRTTYRANEGDSHPNVAGDVALTQAFATGAGNVLDAAWAAFSD